MTKHEPDKQEVLALLDIIDGGAAPLESKLTAIKRIEYILGRPLLNTKEFKKLRDEYTKGAKDGSK
jgi:hypothetical protein